MLTLSVRDIQRGTVDIRMKIIHLTFCLAMTLIDPRQRRITFVRVVNIGRVAVRMLLLQQPQSLPDKIGLTGGFFCAALYRHRFVDTPPQRIIPIVAVMLP